MNVSLSETLVKPLVGPLVETIFYTYRDGLNQNENMIDKVLEYNNNILTLVKYIHNKPSILYQSYYITSLEGVSTSLLDILPNDYYKRYHSLTRPIVYIDYNKERIVKEYYIFCKKYSVKDYYNFIWLIKRSIKRIIKKKKRKIKDILDKTILPEEINEVILTYLY